MHWLRGRLREQLSATGGLLPHGTDIRPSRTTLPKFSQRMRWGLLGAAGLLDPKVIDSQCLSGNALGAKKSSHLNVYRAELPARIFNRDLRPFREFCQRAAMHVRAAFLQASLPHLVERTLPIVHPHAH